MVALNQATPTPTVNKEAYHKKKNEGWRFTVLSMCMALSQVVDKYETHKHTILFNPHKNPIR